MKLRDLGYFNPGVAAEQVRELVGQDPSQWS